MVIILFLLLFMIAVGALFFFWNRFHRFRFIQEMAQEHKKRSWLVAFLPVSVLVLLFFLKPVYAAIISLHLLVFWIFCDFAAWAVKKAGGRKLFVKVRQEQTKKTAGEMPETTKASQEIYFSGIFALLITAVYLGIGWYYGHHVFETHYALFTEKSLGRDSLRIVQVSDAHIGSTFDGDGFAGYMEKVQKTEPDLVVITGDYVDDDTKRADMVRACESLGTLKTTYGVYFVYGNHDKGYFETRDFTAVELEEELQKNHVSVLKDSVAVLNEEIVLIGRKDRSDPKRKSMEELLKLCEEGTGKEIEENTGKYIIVLDHQPHDFDAQEKAGVDLVLCGHTHGGQMFPVGITGELSGENDKTYGLEKRGRTNFIVNSGISDWGIPFRTACIAEYGVIDVAGGSKP